MKDFIIQALNDALPILDRRVPQTKKETIYVDISDVDPLDISSFMKDNNIPNDACFGGKPNSYDAMDYPCLVYEIDVPTTEKEKIQYKRRVFSDISFKNLFNLLTNNGYKRVGGYNTGLLKDFKDTTVYDMYMNKDFDRLERYYSLHFAKDVV